ncbi:PetM family cytochrome b6-f complex subunit 7 [[Limnothrix rosea] IAM M-220]|nr:PetM family cytochrome b6-f complex subunit 7 [[Limnothrix rosea] IAM M-220]OKH12149.1 cytochrome B6 [[Limnothrix rosea] IAM M-220]
MSAESMMFNGFIIAITTVLFGMAWGFLILKIQNKSTGKAD